MPFVKLDCGILNSTLWAEPVERDIFITALLMAVPFEFKDPQPQIAVNEIRETGFVVPPGWYGMVEAAGPGIVRRALIEQEPGMRALARLGEPDPGSRSQAWDGRRLIRINGGYLVLNYMDYLLKDYGAAERMRRLRARKRSAVTVTGVDVTRTVTYTDADPYSDENSKESKNLDIGQQADRDSGFDQFWMLYPKHVKRKEAKKVWQAKKLDALLQTLLADIRERSAFDRRWKEGFIPDPPTYLRGERWQDEIDRSVPREANRIISAVEQIELANPH